MTRGPLIGLVLLGVACNESPSESSIAIATIEVTPAIDTVDVGGQVTFTATPRAADGRPLARPVFWVSGNPAIASIDDNGTVTGHAPGGVDIFAGNEGARGQARAIVKGGATFRRASGMDRP